MASKLHRIGRFQRQFVTRLGLTALLTLSLHLESSTPARAQLGSCTGCTTEQYWDEDLQKWCTRFYCTDPSFPTCMG
jgi:hypothetical protein